MTIDLDTITLTTGQHANPAFDPSNTDLWERDLHAALEALEEP